MKLRVITVNTWKCEGHYYQRISNLADQLKELAPSIVACQECFMSEDENIDTLKYLADKLGMYKIEARGRVKQRLVENKRVLSFSNLGILSQFPIDTKYVYDLPCNEQDIDRKVLHAIITLPNDQPLEVFNIHLTHINNSSLKQMQFKALTKIILSNKTTNLQLICGDFNTSIQSDKLINFMRKTNAIDCYKKGNGSEPRYSLVDEYLNGTMNCVDHIIAIQNKVEKLNFISSGIVFTLKADATSIYPSDHFGIATTFSL